MPSKIFFLIPNIASIILERETFREHEILERNRKKKRKKKALIFKNERPIFFGLVLSQHFEGKYTRVKGKVCNIVVRAAMMYGLETVALTETQKAELEVWHDFHWE